MTANRTFIIAIEISSIVFTNTKKPSYSYRMSLLNHHQVALIILPLWAVGGGDLHARKILFIAAGIVACLQAYGARMFSASLIIARLLFILCLPRLFLSALIYFEERRFYLYRIVEQREWNCIVKEKHCPIRNGRNRVSDIVQLYF